MGFSIATTVLSKAVSQALTDLPTAKDELSISAANTANDMFLTRAINQASAAIATHTKRVFLPEIVQDAFDIDQDPYPYQTPGGFAQLQLSRWPVLAVTSVMQMLALNTPQTLVEGQDFRVEQATGQLLRLNTYTGVGSTWEAVPVTVQYAAGYGELVNETDAVPVAAPYQVTVSQSGAFSCDQAVTDASGNPLVRVNGTPGAGQYSVAAGVYTFNVASAGAALDFAYAVASVPDDLVDVTLRLITSRYRSRGRDPMLVQQDTTDVGTQRWWVGGVPGQTGPFPQEIEGMLDPYCSRVVV